MAHITKSNSRAWYQRESILEDILNELECTETDHFRYWIRGTRYGYIMRKHQSGGRSISLSLRKHGLDTIQELAGSYSQNDTVEQRRVKSLRYILAKAYYQLCCEMLQINCIKKDQHSKAVDFATGTGVDIYQHLLKCKDTRVNKKYPRKKRGPKFKHNRFDILDL